MALKNGIPFNWDDGYKSSLFHNLFAASNQNAVVSGIDFPEIPHNSLFTDSPFGKNWDTKQVVSYLKVDEDDFGQDPDPQKPAENRIIYHTYIDTNAVQLIEAYRKDSLYRKYGSFADKFTDINIYYEDETKDDEFGSICFVRFNETLKKYFKSYKNAIDWLAKEVTDQHEVERRINKSLISLDAQRIKDAIAFELEYGGDGIEIFRKIGLWLLHKLAEEIRGWKYAEKNWDFNHKDYDPIIGSDIMRGVVNKWNSFQQKAYTFFKKCYKVAEWCRANIPEAGEFLANLIYSVVDFFTEILVAIDKFFKLIDDLNKFIAVLNAFICGVLNELMEVAAGIIDLLALLVTLTDKADRALVIEGLEDMLDAYKNNPEKIIDKLTETWNDLKERYSGDKSRYEKAYNAGEDFVDVILFVEILVGVVRLIRNIPKLLKNMEKWVAEKGKQLSGLKKLIAKDIAVDDIDWIAKKKTIGNLGGKILTVKQIRRLKAILSKYGIKLIQEEKVVFKKYHRDLFYYMRRNNKVGGFNATTREFYLIKDSTEIVVFHEQCHLAHWVEVGDDIYKSLSIVEKEMYVWEQIYKNKNLWTKAELTESLKYINEKRMEANLEPLKVNL